MHAELRITSHEQRFALRRPFRIARGVIEEARVVYVEVERGGRIGRGEAWPAARYGESVSGVLAQLRTIACLATEQGHQGPASELPAGAARNALDCALWDLYAKESGRRVWELLQRDPPKPVLSAYTIALDAPELMAEQATGVEHRALLKVKLGGDGDDVARVSAVRAAAPDARLIVDVNEAWSYAQLERNAPPLFAMGVEIIEQPLAAAQDEALRNFAMRARLCADESCRDRASLERLLGKYGYVNIKLDKTGGLSEALALADAATRRGLVLMVGNMLGTSLAMLPALVLAHRCRFVDLDGPALMRDDRPNGLKFQGGWISRPPRSLWGEAGLAG
jgi:L-alanine-DL-glutamate epimerase-like enolase superfamily enzyme